MRLEEDDKCNPALIISHDSDIVYLYVKDRCGAFEGFNLYKGAADMEVILKNLFCNSRKSAAD